MLVHAAAALPIQVTRAAIRSVNVEGAAVTLGAALEAGVRRVVLISSTAVYGVPDHHPIHEDDPLVGVGHYGESKIDAERLAWRSAGAGSRRSSSARRRSSVPSGSGVFEILFDWIREGRRIPILGDGTNRYQLLAVEDLVEAVVRSFDAPVARRGAERRRRSSSARCARISRRSSSTRDRARASVPFRRDLRSSRCGRSSSPASRRSPSGTTGRRTRTRSSRSTRRARGSGGSRPSRTRETLCATYDWYLAHRSELRAAGTTHRVPWDQRALGLLKRLS